VKEDAAAPLDELLRRQHRRLDDLLGRFLAAAEAGGPGVAREAILAFDERLRRHTAFEEEHILGRARGEKLFPGPEEGERERLLRELLLEHVQIREVSGMIVRLITEKEDLASARRLLPNLLSRWDAHTGREEREIFPALKEETGSERVARARRALNDLEDLPPRRS